VDELWARWKRKNLNNLDPATTTTAAGNVTITGTMGPWDGTSVQSDGLPWDNLPGPELDPWTVSGGQIYAKPANDRSITSPFYDTAPLTIPVLQPGEEVILEFPDIRRIRRASATSAIRIPRIETSTTAPGRRLSLHRLGVHG
jgi:hypothetical protein